MSKALKRRFVSEVDEFLLDYDKARPQKSLSQEREITKHARIARLRDGTSTERKDTASEHETSLWEKF